MKIYYIRRMDGGGGYDTFSDAVVIAKNEQEATEIHPYTVEDMFKDIFWRDGMWLAHYGVKGDGAEYDFGNSAWVTPDRVKATQIGTAKRGMKKGAICSSFHAG